MTEPQSAFSLKDMQDQTRNFPFDGAGLICFVKEDCETCNVAAPVLQAMQCAYGDGLKIWLVSQSGSATAELAERHGLTMPILDDAGCRVSYSWDIEAVPSVFWIDTEGRVQRHFEGFIREDWQGLASDLAGSLGQPALEINWDRLPRWQPGCGSKHLDPTIFDRLRAEAEDSPIRARRIEIAEADDPFEFMFDQQISDGLPVVPPTPERVLRMLEGTHWDAQKEIAIVPPNMGVATVEKIAINAVMAGCKPAYLPVVIAAVEAVCTDAFNVHGVTATTMGAAPVMVINGPIRHEIGMNMKLGALGAGNRANATIGRALRLVIRNVGGASTGGVERSTHGNPMKFTMCFAEWEERSPWPPLHVERGFKAEDSVVTVFAMTGGPVHIVDQTSRMPDQIAGSLGMGLEGVFLPKMRNIPIDALLVVCPEHIDTLTSDGPYSKERLRKRIQEVTAKPFSTMVVDEQSGAGIPAAQAEQMGAEALARLVPKFAGEEFIHLVVAGSDAGKFSSALHGWVTGDTGSISVSKKIGFG